jgi:hypothetical protein
MADPVGWEPFMKEVAAMTRTRKACRRLLPGAGVAMRALWTDLAKASRHVPWPETPLRRLGQAGGVSSDWLRTHAIESAKHLDDS